MDHRPPIEISSMTPGNSTTIKIKKENKIFLLTMEYNESEIILNIIEENNLSNLMFSKILILSEIKSKYKLFSDIHSSEEFISFIEAAHKNKKLNIEIKEDKIIMNIISEYLFIQENIEIILLPQTLKLKDVIKNLCQELSILREKIKNIEEKSDKNNNNENLEDKIHKIIDKQNNEINYLKEEIKIIKEENKNLKEENKLLYNKLEELNPSFEQKGTIDINSAILKREEYHIISSAIKERLKKSIKKTKKLYQATKDGGDPSIFHKKCDNIPNTLTLIKSAGNKRFGGFTSETWNPIKTKWKNDKNAFIFSLDKRKVYPYKLNGKAIYCKEECGPCFGFGFDIGIEGDPIKRKKLKTYKSKDSYDYGSDDALSEDKDYNGVNAIDYEVFEIKF